MPAGGDNVKDPLTDEDKQNIESFMQRISLEKLSSPPTREQILSKLGLSNSKATSDDSSGDDDGKESVSSDFATEKKTQANVQKGKFSFEDDN